MYINNIHRIYIWLYIRHSSWSSPFRFIIFQPSSQLHPNQGQTLLILSINMNQFFLQIHRISPCSTFLSWDFMSTGTQIHQNPKHLQLIKLPNSIFQGFLEAFSISWRPVSFVGASNGFSGNGHVVTSPRAPQSSHSPTTWSGWSRSLVWK